MTELSDAALVEAIDRQISHVWMVRRFLKHCDEQEDDEELASVHRDLYNCMLALGQPLADGDHTAYLKAIRKKFRRLRDATELFIEIQPEVSGHMNFAMSAKSLAAAVNEIARLLGKEPLRSP